MMPECPTSCSDRLVRLIAGLNCHIWNKTRFLPVCKFRSNNSANSLLAIFIGRRYCGKKRFWARLCQGRLCHPVDAVESLLVNVIWARHEVRFFPESQAITCVALLVAVVAADRLDFDARA